MTQSRLLKLIWVVVLAAVVYGVVTTVAGPSVTPDRRETSAPIEADRGADRLRLAFEGRQSGVVVETAGVVTRLLADDRRGSRHQRFVLRLPTAQTVLVAHNIDLAPRVPLDVGDTVEFRGQYEWNDRGGVVHWTHHDPDGRRPGGWIRTKGKRYR